MQEVMLYTIEDEAGNTMFSILPPAEDDEEEQIVGREILTDALLDSMPEAEVRSVAKEMHAMLYDVYAVIGRNLQR
jgi:hypothetical protein